MERPSSRTLSIRCNWRKNWATPWPLSCAGKNAAKAAGAATGKGALPQTADPRSRARRFEAERAGPALVDHSAIAADQVEAVGPSGIGLFDGIVHAIDERREADPQSAHTAIGHRESFALGARVAEHDALANVAAHLPDVAGVRLLDIDGVEGDAIPIDIEQSIERGNLPAKGRSSVASEDQHDGTRTAVGGKLHGAVVVQGGQAEIRGEVAGVQPSAARPVPQRLKWQHHHEREGSLGNDLPEDTGRLDHRHK